MRNQRSKYNAQKVVIDGVKFDSKVEGQYYLYLKDLQENGTIACFKIHPTYILQNAFKCNDKVVRAIYYEADFEILYADNHIEVIDVKSLSLPLALIKRKLFLYKYPELSLKWVTYIKSKGGWIDFFENEKMKKMAKKKKLLNGSMFNLYL